MYYQITLVLPLSSDYGDTQPPELNAERFISMAAVDQCVDRVAHSSLTLHSVRMLQLMTDLRDEAPCDRYIAQV